MDSTASKASSQQPQDRVALDSVALVQHLTRAAAEFTAKATAQRLLVEAASKRGLGDLGAEAAVRVEVFEEAATSLFMMVQSILRGNGAAGAVQATGRPAAVATSLQLHCDAVSPSAAKLCRRAEDAKLPPPDRYATLVGLVRELSSSSTTPLPSPVHAALSNLYAAIIDKLPDLAAVATALHEVEAAWPHAEGGDIAVRRGDWFKKMYAHIASLSRLRERVAEGGTSTSMLDGYEKLVDVVAANMTTQKWPGSVHSMVEAIGKELRRLRGDAGVVAAVARLASS